MKFEFRVSHQLPLASRDSRLDKTTVENIRCKSYRIVDRHKSLTEKFRIYSRG